MKKTFLAMAIMLAFSFFSDEGKASSDEYQIYYISIGSSHYENLDMNLPLAKGSNNSARVIAETLDSYGAKGTLLTSEEGDLPDREDLRQALFELKQNIREDNPENPFLIFYYMGHGIGDQASRYLYLPSDVDTAFAQTNTLDLIHNHVWSYDVITSFVFFRMHPTMEHWDNRFVSDFMPNLTPPLSSSDIVDLLEQFNMISEFISLDEQYRREGSYPEEGNPEIPHLIMFDNCFEGIIADLVDVNKLQEETGKSFFDSIMILLLDEITRMSQEIESVGAVLYAKEPGDRTRATYDPPGQEQNPNLPHEQRIGPLARRFLLSLQTEAPLTFENLLSEMQREDLDPHPVFRKRTRAPHTLSLPSSEHLNKIIF